MLVTEIKLSKCSVNVLRPLIYRYMEEESVKRSK